MKTTSFILASLFSAIAWAKHGDSYGYFKKVNDNYVPLSPLTDRNSPLKFTPFTVTDSKPVDLELAGTYAVALDRYTPGVVGFNDGFLGFGFTVDEFNIKYDNQGKIISHQIYECKDNKWVFTKVKKNNETCNEVDIYFLIYDRRTYLPIIEGDKPKPNLEQIPKEYNLQ